MKNTEKLNCKIDTKFKELKSSIEEILYSEFKDLFSKFPELEYFGWSSSEEYNDEDYTTYFSFNNETLNVKLKDSDEFSLFLDVEYGDEDSENQPEISAPLREDLQKIVANLQSVPSESYVSIFGKDSTVKIFADRLETSN